MPKMSGAQALLESLERQNVDTIFGILGGAILPVYDALCGNKKIRHILARHEQCAAHEAEGYAEPADAPGVCMATSGPGATNLVTGIANAYMDSSPVIALNRTNPNIRRQLQLHDWQRRIPRSRHLRHHYSNYKIQLPATLSYGNSPNGYLTRFTLQPLAGLVQS
jgi:glyoxylate carboligase